MWCYICIKGSYVLYMCIHEFNCHKPICGYIYIKGSYVFCSMTCDVTYVLRVHTCFTCVFTNSIVTNQFAYTYVLRVHMYVVT